MEIPYPESAFQWVAYGIAAACLLAVVVLSLLHLLSRGRLPNELTHIDQVPIRSAPAHMIFLVRILAFVYIPESIRSWWPVVIVLACFDLSLLLSMGTMVFLALSQSCRDTWSRAVALVQTYWLGFGFTTGAMLVWDSVRFAREGWVWIISAVGAAFLTPLLARLIYTEYYVPSFAAADTARRRESHSPG